jgi:hypothetical protein
MITHSELQAVYRDLLAEDRCRLGDPPTVEELLAWERGDLAPEQAGRVRQLLACYPDLARALAAPFPADDPLPGDPAFLTGDVVSAQWEALQSRLHGADRAAHEPTDARVLRFWRGATLALAAMLMLAFGGLLWQKQTNTRLAKQLIQPALRWEEQLLLPDGGRGGPTAAKVLSMEGDVFYLVGSIGERRNFSEYRVEIAGSDSSAPLWSGIAQRRDNDTFAILVPHAFLPPGQYEVSLYGVNGAREERLFTYSVRVPER